MPLDVDRLAEAMMEGTRALLVRDLAPIHAALAAAETRATEAEARSEALEARMAALEARPEPDVSEAVEAGVSPLRVALAQGVDVSATLTQAVEEFAARLAEQEARSAAQETVEPPVLPAPDLSGMATKQEVGFAIAGIAALTAQIEALPEPKDFGSDIAEVKAAIPPEPDLSRFATKSDLDAILYSDAFTEPKDFSPEIAALADRIDAIVIPEAIHGKDGRGIADVKVNDDREVIVKFTDGETKNLGKFDGRDGFGFDDMSTDWDGERTLTLSFTKDGRTEVTSLTIPAIIDRGVWKAGTYERGDAVSWGGSLFIAQRDTEDKPETSDAWRLSAKRGRDGKDFRPPEDKGPVKAPSK